MAKCALCGERIETTFLGKIRGTYIRKKPICFECQKKLPTMKEDLLNSLK